MVTTPTPGPLDNLLIPFNPFRGLELWWAWIDELSGLDPKLKAACAQLTERFEPLSDADTETLATVLWGSSRLRLRAGSDPNGFRRWLGDGDRVLRTVETVLRTELTPAAIQRLVQGAGQLSSTDSPDNVDLTRARADVTSMLSTDFGPATVAAVAMGAGLAYLYFEAEAVIHGHAHPDIIIHH
ncbi:hypothetical protein WBG06_16835 [Nocardioides sp. CCNWLW239]|uniref:hypothetical protein n=1 Tax=Nocardioides sp. CCNWLW239 TaxID=3128902 RepID=UPI003019E7CB